MNNNRFAHVLLLGLISLILAGCSTSLKDYENKTPQFDLKNYFTGDLKGWGLVKNWKGEVTQRFSVKLNGQWHNNKGRLYELFTYADGRQQERIWKLEKGTDGVSTGRANDVIGVAHGKQAGFAFHWTYQLQVNMNDDPVTVTLDDWLYQIDEQALVSEAQIKKFGINVGKVLVFIIKQEDSHG